MNNTAMWSLVLFFGCAVVFELLHQLTKHSSTGVQIAVQFGALALIVGGVVLFVRRQQ
jgi:uncharacterized membrane protein HdeD (DUF308 family)